MQLVLFRFSALAGALLLLGATSACVDASRVDALEAGVARMRVDAAQRDWQREQQIAWLRWGQVMLAGEVRGHGTDRDGLARRLAALEAENADLTARLERAEQRRDLPVAVPSPAFALVETPARVLDENVPYDLGGFVPRRPGKRAAPPPPRPASVHARRLDENVPYDQDARSSDARSTEAKVFPRVLDETVPY
jgi:hypothetical protein